MTIMDKNMTDKQDTLADIGKKVIELGNQCQNDYIRLRLWELGHDIIEYAYLCLPIIEDLKKK